MWKSGEPVLIERMSIRWRHLFRFRWQNERKTFICTLSFLPMPWPVNRNDPQRLEQVLKEFAGECHQFTENGSVTLSIGFAQ